MQINTVNLDKLRVGFQSLYNGGFLMANPQWKRIAMHIKSTTGEEKYGWLGNTTAFREWIGDRVLQNLKEHDFTIKNKTFENTVSVSREKIEDDTLGNYSINFKQLGFDAAMHPDTLVFPLLPAGFNTVCYDGQYFFDTDHPVTLADGTLSSYSNSGGGAGAPWFLLDVSKPVLPLIFQERRAYKFTSLDKETDENVFKQNNFLYGVDARCNAGYALPQLAYGSKQTLNAANYEAARAAMIAMKGDGGKPLNVTPTLLVVGPSNEAAAKRIVAAEKDAAGTDNINYGTAEVLVSPYLT